MSLSLAVIRELGEALGEAIPERLAAALARIEAAERVTGGDDVTSPVASPGAARAAGPSKAALRTRRWRDRKRAAAGEAGPVATPESVTAASPEASHTVTPSVTGDGAVTVAGKKEVPPTPPLRKNPHPKRGPRRPKRHAVTVAMVPEAERSVFVEDHTALYRELLALRGRGASVPSTGKGGWYFPRWEIDRAGEALRQRVARFPVPSRLAIGAALLPASTADPPEAAARSG